jgi:hypothetical protein
MTQLAQPLPGYSVSHSEIMPHLHVARPQPGSSSIGVAIDVAMLPAKIATKPLSFFADWATESADCVRSLLR